MPTIHVNLGPRSYDIQLKDADSNQFAPWLQSLTATRTACIIFDRNVQLHTSQLLADLQTAGFRCHQIPVEPGEEQKSLSMLSQLYDELAGMKADRQTLVMAMGGGVIGDLAGFAAACFNRGLPLIMIPTTVLAMVDSSVGGKVGINHIAGKNLIGAFHQPRGVWIDPHHLSTLPSREFNSGLAEVVKYGMILDADFFHWLEDHADDIMLHKPQAMEHLITRSCQLKAQVVEQDEYETTGVRAVLNFGHTFAHAFEKVEGYGRLLHGEAVAIGMVSACRLAENLNMISGDVTTRLIQLLDRFELPTEVDPNWPIDALLEAMRHDKKNVAGQLRFVLPRRIGQVEAGFTVDEELVSQILQRNG